MTTTNPLATPAPALVAERPVGDRRARFDANGAATVGEPVVRLEPSRDLRGIVQATRISRSTVTNMRQNLAFAFAYNALGIPLAAGILYPHFGLLLSPMVAALAMSLSSVSVVVNALRQQWAR